LLLQAGLVVGVVIAMSGAFQDPVGFPDASIWCGGKRREIKTETRSKAEV
jgi:hypothetical protein